MKNLRTPMMKYLRRNIKDSYDVVLAYLLSEGHVATVEVTYKKGTAPKMTWREHVQ